MMKVLQRFNQSRGSSRNLDLARGSADHTKSTIGSSMTLDTNLFREKLLMNKDIKNQKIELEERERKKRLEKNYGIASALQKGNNGY
jgi:hypothetical protein